MGVRFLSCLSLTFIRYSVTEIFPQTLSADSTTTTVKYDSETFTKRMDHPNVVFFKNSFYLFCAWIFFQVVLKVLKFLACNLKCLKEKEEYADGQGSYTKEHEKIL